MQIQGCGFGWLRRAYGENMRGQIGIFYEEEKQCHILYNVAAHYGD